MSKLKPKKLKTKSDKLLYGRIFHYVVEQVSSKGLKTILPYLRSVQVFQQWLKPLFPYASTSILKSVLSKLHKVRLDRFVKLHKRFTRLGYELRTEWNFIVVTRKKKFKLIRPDLVYFKPSKRHVVVLELKSGKRFFIRQLKKYYKDLTRGLPTYRVDLYLYLAGWDHYYKYNVKKNKLEKIL